MLLSPKYYYGGQNRENELGHTACMRETKIAYKILAGKSDGKRQLGKPRHR